MSENEFSSLKKYLKIIADSILVPYIHLAERDDKIWNPESERQAFHFDSGGHLVTTALSIIRKHEIYPVYEELFQNINAIKVAKWSFEKL